MRNLAGILAQRKLTRTIIATLSIAGTRYRWLQPATKSWLIPSAQDPPTELDAKSLTWSNTRGPRTILYNLTVPLVRKNVDFSLFDLSPDQLTRTRCKDPQRYLALGELKGGIDPAGADEHWKTAGTALSRIREAFSARGATPCTFAVFAAIVPNMAQEIWHELEQGTLNNAANLTNPNQVASMCRWLVRL
jgi:type II restriction enzyme